MQLLQPPKPCAVVQQERHSFWCGMWWQQPLQKWLLPSLLPRGQVEGECAAGHPPKVLCLATPHPSQACPPMLYASLYTTGSLSAAGQPPKSPYLSRMVVAMSGRAHAAKDERRRSSSAPAGASAAAAPAAEELQGSTGLDCRQLWSKRQHATGGGEEVVPATAAAAAAAAAEVRPMANFAALAGLIPRSRSSLHSAGRQFNAQPKGEQVFAHPLTCVARPCRWSDSSLQLAVHYGRQQIALQRSE